MSICLVIKTNSAYSYIWPIIEDYTKSIQIHKVLAYDVTLDRVPLPKHFNEYICYEQTNTYSQRLLDIMMKIDFDYVVFVPDIDIIINLDLNALNIYVDIMKKNMIDRVHLSAFDGYEQIHKHAYALCNLNNHLKQRPNHFIPIDSGPVLWKKTSFVELLHKFPNETYNSLELNVLVQNYCKQYLKCYGIQVTPRITIKYHYGRTYSSDLDFLHLTVKGNFLKPFYVYYDYEKELNHIIEKYKLDMSWPENYLTF